MNKRNEAETQVWLISIYEHPDCLVLRRCHTGDVHLPLLCLCHSNNSGDRIRYRRISTLFWNSGIATTVYAMALMTSIFGSWQLNFIVRVPEYQPQLKGQEHDCSAQFPLVPNSLFLTYSESLRQFAVFLRPVPLQTEIVHTCFGSSVAKSKLTNTKYSIAQFGLTNNP